MSKHHLPKAESQFTLEVNKPQGPSLDDNGPQASCKHAEAGEGFDAALKVFSSVIGIDDGLFCIGLLTQIQWLVVGRDGSFDSGKFRFLIACLRSNRPLDQTEALQRVHAVATHVLTMESGAQLRFATTPQEADIAQRTYNKLAQTFLAQCQALNPGRSGGAQKVTVVTVSDRSQAIVGDVTQGTRDPSSDKAAPPMASLADAEETPTPPIDEGAVGSGNRVRRRRKKNGE
jgi:hypothetical protein